MISKFLNLLFRRTHLELFTQIQCVFNKESAFHGCALRKFLRISQNTHPAMKSLLSKVINACDGLLYDICFARIKPSQVFYKIVALRLPRNYQEKHIKECYV